MSERLNYVREIRDPETNRHMCWVYASFASLSSNNTFNSDTTLTKHVILISPLHTVHRQTNGRRHLLLLALFAFGLGLGSGFGCRNFCRKRIGR